ncbi:MAG: glycoside hydrolase family 3 C-terminal domain-containing protein [Cyclobacteriaceae bacterium]|jgi:beta-glucosidase
MKRIFLVAGIILFFQYCNTSPETVYPFQNPDLSIEERVNDLVDRLTLEEKIGQLNYDAPAIERLDIPAYNWWNECLHGVGRAGKATVFPQAIGMAASWNTKLIGEIGEVISDEARAKYNKFQELGKKDIYYGLTFWTPNINIFRDPRWGRGQETYGEDPYLTGELAVSFIKALQGEDPNYLKVVATSKHYGIHSGPEHSRHSINLDVDNIDLWETYLPAFEKTIKKADVASIMCAYNRFRDEACCGSNLLLQSILRDNWKFNGYVVSDCWALHDFYRENGHHLNETPEEAAALAFKTGTDLNCGSTSPFLLGAVEQGLITEEEIDIALKRLFTARIKLGMFDPSDEVPYSDIPYKVVRNKPHLEMALQASRESIVLLKNDNLLPLSEDIKNIAVIGPLADDYRVLLGNYHGSSDNLYTPLRGIKEYTEKNGIQVEYETGCLITNGVPVLTPIPSDFLTASGKTGLNARYFDNRDFEGDPEIIRRDKTIDFSWNDKTPISKKMADPFSVIWEGYIKAPVTGEYAIGINAGNGAKLYFEDSLKVEFDNIHHPLQKSFYVELEGGMEYAIKIEFFSYGNDPVAKLLWSMPYPDMEENALKKIKDSDITLLFMGLSPYLEGEEMPIKVEGFSGGDRTDIKLPSTQLNFINKVVQTGKPVVLVLMGGSAIAVNDADKNIPAILHSWYPGEFGGMALAEILFGDVNPSGKLPVTFYKSIDDIPEFEDYNMHNRTYKYFPGDPLYPFGHGLSYTYFEYSDLDISDKEFDSFDEITLEVDVKNTGQFPGAEVVQLYINDMEASVRIPNIALEGFQKIYLEAGEQRTVNFTIMPDQLAIINEMGEKIIEPGSFKVYVGGKQPNMKGTADNKTTQVLSTEIEYTGPAVKL